MYITQYTWKIGEFRLTEIKIRNVKEIDFLEIMEIATSCDPIPIERDSIYHNFTRYFANTCFVAEEGERIVGFVLGWISQVDDAIAYIHNICVIPDMRKKRIATRLYDTFIQAVRELGCNKVLLIISPKNRNSLTFHQALGFKISEEGEGIEVDSIRAVKDYNGPGKHMVVMHKDI